MDTETSLSKLQGDIHTALKSWHDNNPEVSPIGYLQLYQQVQAEGTNSTRHATNKVLLNALEILAADYKAEADILRKRYLDGLQMHTVANQLNVGESTAYRKQQEAVKKLTVIVRDMELRVRSDYQANLEKRLKLPGDVQLFGVEEYLSKLQDILALPGPTWLVSIEGLGGIGKTTMANALIRHPQLTSRFYDVSWISAKQQDFLPEIEPDRNAIPALTDGTLIDLLLEQLDNTISLAKSPPEKYSLLTEILKQNPHLIVIDNLETVADYQTLLPTLRDLANPSKFLLTSRHSLRAYSDVYCHSLGELKRTEALRLIRHESKLRGLSMLANASEADLNSIYETVGGNPLALKLVVGQVSILPLSQVLASLKEARGKDIDQLYNYIYWRAWHMLDAASQQVFLMMPLAQNGTLEQLMALTKLDIAILGEALQRLVKLSLVQTGGDLEDRRYIIHRLTETFLLKEALVWKKLA